MTPEAAEELVCAEVLRTLRVCAEELPALPPSMLQVLPEQPQGSGFFLPPGSRATASKL